MSRCYPYPPPGYAGKSSIHEALIFSIKLQNERERAISNNGAEMLKLEKSKSSEKMEDREHRKKEKKDKRERRKERKERKREKKVKAGALVDNGKHGDVGKLPKAGNAAFENGKVQGSSAELLESSSVTEEHGQPIELQNTSCSSDSTGNSGKRKRVAASPSGIQSNGNVIRIRLSSSQYRNEPSTSSQYRNEPSTSGSKEQEIGAISQAASQYHVWPGVTLVKPEFTEKLKDVIRYGPTLPPPTTTSMATSQLVPMRDNIAYLKEKTTETIPKKEKLSSRDKKMQKKESSFNKLFVDWVPPPLESTLLVDENEDNEEWLFGKKGEDRSAKRLRVSEEYQTLGYNPSCSASAVIQPRAQLLRDVGIYALPFTVPF